MPSITHFILLLAALGSATIGGTFFAFAAFVTRALARLPAPQGIAAMQSINLAVINPLFMTAFLGTAFLSLLAIIFTLLHWTPASPWILAAAALYLVGTLGVTIALNVPLNNALAPLDPTDPASAAVWQHYLSRWTLWNTIRTIASLAATLCFILSLRK